MYECHVTTEYLGEEDRGTYELLTSKFTFKMGKLYMKKDEKSEMDSFFTCHHDDFQVIKSQMLDFIKVIKDLKIKVLRYKIEDIVLDSKYQGDLLEIL